MLSTLFIAATLLSATNNSSISLPTRQAAPSHQNAATQKTSAAAPVAAPPLTDEKQAGDPGLPITTEQTGDIKYYNHPGVVAHQGVSEPGKPLMEWIGGDHLINLPANIPIQVDLSLPGASDLKINEKTLEKIADDVFKKYDINPDLYTDASVPPLPFFQIVVTVYEIQKVYVYIVHARLFESVSLDRVAFDEGVALQAVTWEMTSVNGVPLDKLSTELNQSVAGIATTFAQRYAYFKKIEDQHNDK